MIAKIHGESVWTSKDGRIEVVYKGRVDRESVYAIVRDGRTQYPWISRRDAIREAKEQEREMLALLISGISIILRLRPSSFELAALVS